MNNEEKILEMLAALTETVNRQGELLAKQGEQLAELKFDVGELREIAVRGTHVVFLFFFGISPYSSTRPKPNFS